MLLDINRIHMVVKTFVGVPTCGPRLFYYEPWGRVTDIQINVGYNRENHSAQSPMSRPPIAQPLPVDLRNWSFRGMNCAGWDFSRRDIRGCDFRNANLKGVNFSNAIAGATQKQQFKHVIMLIPAVFTGFAIGLFLVGSGASTGGMVVFVAWKKRPIIFDFALSGLFWGTVLGASLKITSALSNGKAAYAMGIASIAFLGLAIWWSYEAKKSFKSKIGTTFKNANLEDVNFSDAVLDNCNFDKANLTNVSGFLPKKSA